MYTYNVYIRIILFNTSPDTASSVIFRTSVAFLLTQKHGNNQSIPEQLLDLVTYHFNTGKHGIHET